ncbi:hypothetical protein K388_05596 [Streptomyces sp. KhCrAH-43]|nr:hypothetical protein K388_05596 [Streptomyces sp. KhCrAH-43]
MSPKKPAPASIRRGPKVPVTVAEWDVTPGLHEWIEGEIERREKAARSHGVGPVWEYDEELRAVRDAISGEAVAHALHHGAGDHIMLNDPDAVLRHCAADRKILAAHPYTTVVVNPQYGQHTAGFGCETCHDWDGVPEGRGNCATILALAEAYGLDEAEETDVEVIDMPKKKRTPAQKLAREIQAATGKPYTECLAEAQRQLAGQQVDQ